MAAAANVWRRTGSAVVYLIQRGETSPAPATERYGEAIRQSVRRRYAGEDFGDH
jgi:hypothetical protein